MAGLTGTQDLCSIVDVTMRLTLPPFEGGGSTPRFDTVQYNTGNWFRAYPWTYPNSLTEYLAVSCENWQPPNTPQFRLWWTDRTEYVGWRVVHTVTKRSFELRCVSQITDDGYGQVIAYVDGEQVFSNTTTYKVTPQNLTSLLFVRRGMPSSLQYASYALNNTCPSVQIGNLTATVWACRQEVLLPPRTHPVSNIRVLTDDSGAASTVAFAGRNWQQWYDTLAAIPEDPSLNLSYRPEGDLCAIINQPLSAVQLANVDDEPAIYLRAGYPNLSRLYTWLRAEYYIPGGGRIHHAITDNAARTKLAFVEDDTLKFRRVEYIRDAASYSEPVTIADAGANYVTPCLVAYADGSLACWYMEDGVQRVSRSYDDGRTWTLDEDAMLGSNLTNLFAVQYEGITAAVGVRDSALYFVRSNDQGETQDTIPGSALNEQYIGACAANAAPCLVWYPDGQLLVAALDPEGNTVNYANRNSGYGAWEEL